MRANSVIFHEPVCAMDHRPTLQQIAVGLLALVVIGGAGWIIADRIFGDSQDLNDRQELVARADSLERLLARRDSLFRPVSGLTDWQISQLQRKGLENPARQLVDSLVDHPDLIPYDGVAGGTMAFRPPTVQILSGRWMFAGFDDGHIAGHMLVEYSVASDGSLSWRAIDAYLE